MQIEFDSEKRRVTLAVRGLDMADARLVYSGKHITFADIRFDYREDRFVTVGFLFGRMVILTWTPRGDAHRIISLRKANEREQRKFGPDLDRP
ncbi:MAG: BrnT family toxin [Rubellimicrobium sp.]|nr:BrnT family toxin [Rubellimicrobium sp.]